MKSSKLIKISVFILIILLLAFGIFLRIQHKRTKFTDSFDHGNSGGNLYNGGYFCEYNGIVYFSNPNDNHALYSITRSGNDLKKISGDKVAYINADDNYVYYTRNNSDTKSDFSFLNIQTCSLCRVDISGKNRLILDGDPCLYSTQVGNYVYYIHYDKKEASTLYRIKIDGSERKQVAKEPLIAVASDQKFLYYTGVKNNHDLHRIDTTDESTITVIKGNFYNPIIADEYVYYMDADNNYALTKMNISTQDKFVVTNDRVDCFNLSGSYLYYQRNGSSPALCKIKTDGTEFEEIYAGSYANINVTSSYVYFSSYEDIDTFYYTPTTGKTNISVFNPNVIED